MSKLDAQNIINYIGNAPKKTPVKVYLKGDLENLDFQKRFKILSMLKVA